MGRATPHDSDSQNAFTSLSSPMQVVAPHVDKWNMPPPLDIIPPPPYRSFLCSALFILNSLSIRSIPAAISIFFFARLHYLFLLLAGPLSSPLIINGFCLVDYRLLPSGYSMVNRMRVATRVLLTPCPISIVLQSAPFLSRRHPF